MQDLVQWVNEVKKLVEKTTVLKGSINTDNLYDEKIETLERQIYVLDKRRLSKDFYKELTLVREKDFFVMGWESPTIIFLW